MRRPAALCLAAAAMLASAGASASDTPKNKADSYVHDAAPSAPADPSAGNVSTTLSGQAQGRTTEEAGGLYEYRKGTSKAKFWEVGIQWETHALVIQNDLEGAAPDKIFNVVFLYAKLDITKNDRLRIDGGFFERFIADQNESGVRAQDLVLSYMHTFHLPYEIDLRATARVTAPIGFYSQLAGLITAPSASIDLSRDWDFGGKKGGLSVNLRGSAGGFVVRYAEKSGGNPNPRANVGLAAAVEYRFGFHPRLSLGASFFTGYFWFYDVNGLPDPNRPTLMATADPQFASQPAQQVYCDEIFARYALPQWKGFKAAAQVAFAQGDSTLGCTSVLHDGVFHAYPVFWRLNSEVYAALSLRY